MAKDPADLLKYVVDSPSFRKAGLAKKLLNFLFNNRMRFVKGKEIYTELWGDDYEYDDQKVRERIYDLKGRLREIEDVTDSSFYFELPDNEGEGYRLQLPEKKPLKETAAFWRQHTRSDNVTLVYAEPVFFYDVAAGRYIRYLDTNPRDIHTAVTELETKHGKELQRLYDSPLAQNLVPRSVYIGIGEVEALDILGKWFLKRSFLKVRRQASNRMSGVQQGCPVLIGSERTNRFIAALLNSEEAQHFTYRQHNKIGFVSMKNSTEKEEERLKKKFTVLKDANGKTIAGNEAQLSIVRDRLAILYRMPTPGGKGTITMIVSDTPPVIRQVAFALTDDDQMEGIMRTTGWNGETLPHSFEMLFGVKVAPANIEHEAGVAELLTWRGHPQEKV